MKKIALAALLAAAAGFGTYQALSKEDPETVVPNRVWIDHMPKGETDLATIFVLVGEEDGLGLVAKQSRWRSETDIYQWKATQHSRDKYTWDVTTMFPQFRTRENFSVTTNCKAPQPFDLCMKVESRNKGKIQTKFYYSMWDWEVETLDEDQITCLTRGC